MSLTLPESFSIFSAEAHAICRALEYFESCDGMRLLLCTDSLSVLQTLREMYVSPDVTKPILEALHRCQKAGKRVAFAWVPAHVGIEGN